MRELLHKAMIVAAIVLAAALVFAVLYYGLFPRLSYRKLVMAVTAEDSLESAEIVRGSHITALTDKQCLGVASWLAEYRSENTGISHAAEAGGYELLLDDCTINECILRNIMEKPRNNRGFNYINNSKVQFQSAKMIKLHFRKIKTLGLSEFITN